LTERSDDRRRDRRRYRQRHLLAVGRDDVVEICRDRVGAGAARDSLGCAVSREDRVVVER
jgi:hypothetical protein